MKQMNKRLLTSITHRGSFDLLKNANTPSTRERALHAGAGQPRSVYVGLTMSQEQCTPISVWITFLSASGWAGVSSACTLDFPAETTLVASDHLDVVCVSEALKPTTGWSSAG
jgi:hypothetical protein